MSYGKVAGILVVALAALACATTPPPVPIDMDELVHLSRGGPDSAEFLGSLKDRPIGFPLTVESIHEMEERGMSREAIDAVIETTVERRARDLAPRYGYYEPYFHPWPFVWYYDIGWYHFRRY